jgi:hypothetical protein
MLLMICTYIFSIYCILLVSITICMYFAYVYPIRLLLTRQVNRVISADCKGGFPVTKAYNKFYF